MQKYRLQMVAFALVALSATAYITYRVQIADRRLISVSILPLLAGAIFETRRISEKWTDVLITTLVAFIGSFMIFLPGKHESNYDIEKHIENWPYAFLGFFIVSFISFHADKVRVRLTEGITLMQSVAVGYWVIEHGLATTEVLPLKILMGIGLAFSLFSAFHALTYRTHSRASRLALSIWSSIIMMVFAVDQAISVFSSDLDHADQLDDKLYGGLQYFLLGVSSIYMAQNIMMLVSFLPGKGTFFNKRYFEDLQALKNEHIGRYSENQVAVFHSVLCILFAGGSFFLNDYYQLVPAHTAIWIVFTIFPLVLTLSNKIAAPESGG